MKVRILKAEKIEFPKLMYNERNNTLILATGFWDETKHNYKGVCLKSKHPEKIGKSEGDWNAVAFKIFEGQVLIENN